MKKTLSLILLCFLSAASLWFAQIRRDQLTLAGQIAPKILRFHVIANSNSAEDQEIKLKVKSYFLETIYQKVSSQKMNKDTMKSFLSAHKEELERDTEAFIRSLGKSYPVSLDITCCEFPEKFYGEFRLPAGTYETARLNIGAARGHNWWCVLYPQICVTKDAVTAVPDSSLEELRELLSPEDYQKLLFQRPDFTPKLRLSFYSIDKFNTWKSSLTAPSAPQDR